MALICVDAKNLPSGALLVEGREYTLLSERMNSYGEKIVFLEGIQNNGRTKMGLEWNGFKATRFKDTEKVYDEVEEVNFAMN